MWVYVYVWLQGKAWVYAEMPCFGSLTLQVTCFFLSSDTRIFALKIQNYVLDKHYYDYLNKR